MNQDMIEDLDDAPLLLEVLQEIHPRAGPSQMQDRPKIPITLLTGYLGAGKSTLLEYILTADHGYRIAVCMNDFGDTTDIEARTLTLSDPETKSQTTSFLSLPNGCLCCSVKDMGIAAIEDMVASQAESVDWVVVELTGVADPAPIAKSFWSNEEMGDLLLDGVICVVDSRNVLKQLSIPNNACQQQIACADVILLNKVDLVAVPNLDDVEREVRRINSTLRVHRTERSRVDLGELFDLKAYSTEPGLRNLTDEPGSTNRIDKRKHFDHNLHVDDQYGDEDSHDHMHSDITSVVIPLPPLDQQQFDKLDSFLESLLWGGKLPLPVAFPAPEILRTKGYITMDDGRSYILQGVTDIFELKEVPEAASDGMKDEQGKVIFIGRGMSVELVTILRTFVGIDALVRNM